MSSIKVWEGTHTKVQSSNFRSMSYSNILTLDLASIYKKTVDWSVGGSTSVSILTFHHRSGSFVI